MKKITIVLSALMLGVSCSFAQKGDFKSVESQFILQKYEDAKVAFDKAIAKTPGAAKTLEGYLWKCRVLCEMYANPELAAKYPNALKEAFDAFLEYEKLEPNHSTLATSPMSSLGWRILDVLYTNNFNEGRRNYTKKAYDSAYFYYDRCAYMSKITMAKDLRKNGGTLDTIPILMAGYSAQNAKMAREAVNYYSFAIEKGYAGAEGIDVYRYILAVMSDIKDKAGFDKYYDISQKTYPNENWEDYKLDYVSKNSNLDEKIALYDKEDAAGTLSYTAYMYFGDMFVNPTKEEKDAIDKNVSLKESLHNKGREAFKKAFTKKNTEGLAAFNAGVLYYNDFGAADDKFRDGISALQKLNAEKPIEKDPKKKAAADAAFKTKLDEQKKINADLDSKAAVIADLAIEWLEKAVPVFQAKAEKTKTEKNSLKNAVNYLTNLFQYKRDKARGKDVKAFDAFEAKYKMYDELYGKL